MRRFIVKKVSFLYALILCILLWIGGIFLIWNRVELLEPSIYHSVSLVPYNHVGLLLWTNPNTKDHENIFFRTRIDTAVKLYTARKIRSILVSGDNRNKNYNEPASMWKALIAQWIPKEVIYYDYAGLRTLDSIIRAKEIFWQNSFTIISQDFHLKRALYIAQWFHIQAIGFSAWEIDFFIAPRVYLREIGARFMAYIDILFHIWPKHLGNTEYIP